MRSHDVHGRIILDSRWVPEKAGEAKYAMQGIPDLAPPIPGAQGGIYDTALRGMHPAELMRDLGWLSINRVQAAAVQTRDGKPVKRVKKLVHIEDKVVDGRPIRLFVKGGELGIAEVDTAGEQHFTELKRWRTLRREDKNGKFRWYNEYMLPVQGTVVVLLDTTEQDVKRKLNRSENLRKIPPGDPDLARLYRRRNDIESMNRALDDSM